MDYHSLHMKTVVELRKIAKDERVRIPAGTSKAGIIDLILEQRGRAADAVPETRDQTKEAASGTEAPAPEIREEIASLPVAEEAVTPLTEQKKTAARRERVKKEPAPQEAAAEKSPRKRGRRKSLPENRVAETIAASPEATDAFAAEPTAAAMEAPTLTEKISAPATDEPVLTAEAFATAEKAPALTAEAFAPVVCPALTAEESAPEKTDAAVIVLPDVPAEAPKEPVLTKTKEEAAEVEEKKLPSASARGTPVAPKREHSLHARQQRMSRPDHRLHERALDPSKASQEAPREGGAMVPETEENSAGQPMERRTPFLHTTQRMGARTQLPSQQNQPFRRAPVGGRFPQQNVRQTAQTGQRTYEQRPVRNYEQQSLPVEKPIRSEPFSRPAEPQQPQETRRNYDALQSRYEPQRYEMPRPVQPQETGLPVAEEMRYRPAYVPDPRSVNPGVPDLLAAGDCADGAGVLEIHPDGYGFLRAENYLPGTRDTYVSIAQIRRFNLRTGDYVEGKTRPQREGDRYNAIIYITKINGESPEKAIYRKPFDALVPVYPDERLRMENPDGKTDMALRLIDILAPIGKGQRGMIVSQPKAGKTTLIKMIANAITENHPEVHLIVLLIDERPEEVTDMKRSIQGEVAYSTFDEAPENHTRISEMVLERSQRLVEQGKDVVILLDSITRLARAYNLVIPPTGRSLSGGLDPGALHKPKRFFGAARNIEGGGSLTIIATALVETGSRMDDIIFEEFKGTGNMELHLDRKLSDRRIFPAIDMYRSGTRREELLLTQEELTGAYAVRKMLSGNNSQDSAEQLIAMMEKTSNNKDFFARLQGWIAVMEKEGFH